MESMNGLARRLEAPLHGNDARFTRVITDTRQLAPGDLFVALKGERFDGHHFIEQARKAGAVGALVSEAQPSNLPQVVVGDTLAALQALAVSWRGDFHIPVVGVTGSNGKTTVKQMLSSILARRGPVLATIGNLNNHIGVPLTLLSMRDEHKTAVVEMGANHPGEIAALAALAQPDIGVVNNAGDAHLEGFGSREGVARAKGEMFEALEHGVSVINVDDDYAPLWRELARGDVITFGLSDDADVRAVHARPEPPEAPVAMEFELRTPEGRVGVKLPLPGLHNVRNALAAAACAVAAGLDARDIAAGLLGVRPASGRLTWRRAHNGARLLDDTYNANPSSLRAGLELLAGVQGRRWLVLGDMAELGRGAEQMHFAAGEDARALGIERLYAAGPLAREAAKGFGDGAVHFEDVAALVAEVRERLAPDVALLVKGSRSARMERVVAGLTGEETTGGAH
ncbi:MAG TPA: UDP-N-acetylmuramoyl-tripeptide--D-alanyl-D-alanine ligase [Verrucomicrobiae bacterium]|nr:UDP-N-acetylmuramoyl-tripeptide--D-alanyl-D-alanine ligase [Verrucomicrobiae bacterium]